MKSLEPLLQVPGPSVLKKNNRGGCTPDYIHMHIEWGCRDTAEKI